MPPHSSLYRLHRGNSPKRFGAFEKEKPPTILFSFDEKISATAVFSANLQLAGYLLKSYSIDVPLCDEAKQ